MSTPLDSVKTVTRDLLAFVEIPSFHGSPGGVPQAAAFLYDQMRAAGFEVERRGSSETPYLLGHLAGNATGSLLVYVMYDIRTPELIPTARAELRALPEIGEALWSPLPIGNKAQAITFLAAIELARRSGQLPSVTMIAEGVETLGSPALENFVAQSTDSQLFEGVNAAFWPRESQDRFGRAWMHLGYRGMLGVRMTASGASWGRGPAKAPVHSQYRPWVEAPTWRLVDALRVVNAQDGSTTDESAEFGDWSPVRAAVKLDDHLAELGILGNRTVEDTDAFRRLENQVSVNLEFEAAASTGVGQVQSSASARLQFRLPPQMRWETMVGRITKELDAAGMGDVTCEVSYAMNGALIDPTGPVIAALEAAYRSAEIPIVRWPVGPSTPPIVVFQTQLGVPIADGGVGRVMSVSGGEAIVIGRGTSPGVAERIEFHASVLSRLALSLH